MPKKRPRSAGLGYRRPKKKIPSPLPSAREERAPSLRPNRRVVRANYEETQEDDDDDDDDDDDESLDQNSALEDHLKEKRNQLFEQVELSQRMAIAYMFVNGLGMPLNEETWKGKAVNRHFIWTANLSVDDERKFDLSTPLRATRAHKKIYDPDTGIAPSSSRILQDCDKVYESMETIRKEKGIRVDGVGERHGGGRDHRLLAPRAAGGYRPRLSDPHDYSKAFAIHVDAVEARLDSMHRSTAIQQNESNNEEEDEESDNSNNSCKILV